MQPELSPPDNMAVSPWHYATLFPTFLAFAAVFVSVFAWVGQWGGSSGFAMSLAVVFSQSLAIVSLIGIAGFFMQEQKCKRRRVIALWNSFLLLGAVLCNAYFFFYLQ